MPTVVTNLRASTQQEGKHPQDSKVYIPSKDNTAVIVPCTNCCASSLFMVRDCDKTDNNTPNDPGEVFPWDQTSVEMFA